MKRIMCVYIVCINFYVAHAQMNLFSKPAEANYQSQNVPTDGVLNELHHYANIIQQGNEANRQYVDQLINAVLQLKTQTGEKQFLDAMDSYFKRLKNFNYTANGNRTVASIRQEIRDMEIGIKEEINKYNIRMRNSTNSSPGDYSGKTVASYRYAPIYSEPDTSSKQIGITQDDKVIIIAKINDQFYYVDSGTTKGFLSSQWIK